MEYIDVDYLINSMSEAEMAQLTNDLDSAPVMEAAIAETAIIQAESIVNSFIGVRYAIPLPVVPEVIRFQTMILAKYILFSRRSFVTTEIQEEYDGVMQWLRMIARGNAVLYGLMGKEVDTDAFAGNARFDKHINIFHKRLF